MLSASLRLFWGPTKAKFDAYVPCPITEGMQVRITIRGREYTVRGDDNGNDLQLLAADLDRRMTETAERTRSFDEYTIAMLTALNIASELQQLKAQVADRLDELDRDAASVAAMIEAALPDES